MCLEGGGIIIKDKWMCYNSMIQLKEITHCWQSIFNALIKTKKTGFFNVNIWDRHKCISLFLFHHLEYAFAYNISFM